MGAESIPMMYQGIQLNDPLEQYGKRAALSHMAAQGRLIDSQVAEREQANTLSRMRQQALAGAGGDMDRAKASLMSMGDYAGAHEIEKNQLDTQKTQADISSTNTKNQAALWDHRKQVAAFIADGGTLDHAGMAVDALVKGGDVQGAQWLHGLIQQYPNATPDQIRQAMQPIINMGVSAENRSMPKYEDAGGVKKNINPFVQSPDIAKTQTPDSLAGNQVAREGHQVTIRGQNMADTRAAEKNKIDSLNGPKLTEVQSKAQLYGTRAQAAHSILNSLEGKYSPLAVNAKMAVNDTPLIGGAGGLIANSMLSESGQKAEQAQRDFVNAILRQESGAVISEPEFRNAQKQYFPQPGDTKGVLKQKRENRARAIKALDVMSGPAGGFSKAGQDNGASGEWTDL